MKRKTDNFSKFINRKSPGAVKEEIRQEKKLIKKERKEGIEKHFEEKRNKRAVAISLKAGTTSNASGSDRGAKSSAASSSLFRRSKAIPRRQRASCPVFRSTASAVAPARAVS